ncbi:DUF6909 family protein [Aureibacter tunicatorum]|uniref:Uncharacterized protein n=1 Tax=Aureibacter tunicatorum TaxID=866807 RepID=A0AAE4BTB9_9BACT|nr:hypothetical protein [Aureibacter tunicatorum]MDR6239683.1 hypothetical protein [Aureibacter tunicatorum]BDD04159.1 hypothetical protein AUTU_16420 [Aureibacter tunicatorum]
MERTKAQESRAAIEKLYIVMRHLFIRGYYKPAGESGKAIVNALLTLSPEIYGSVGDAEKVELDGLVYVIDRLPRGIEQCRYVTLTSDEGLRNADFEVIVPSKRRRNCYRIDQDQMYIEVTRGRSEIYDILTHLTFLFIEAGKIKDNAIDAKGRLTREWLKVQEIALRKDDEPLIEKEIAFTYLSALLGRSFAEVQRTYERFNEAGSDNSGLFQIVYWLGKLAIDEDLEGEDRKISFTSSLRERIGHHIYGELWANNIKAFLAKNELLERPLHIISANLHSVMNTLYSKVAEKEVFSEGSESLEQTALLLSQRNNSLARARVEEYANDHGLSFLSDSSGMNIGVQVIDTSKINVSMLPKELGPLNKNQLKKEKPVILVMDYAFGEQAFETLDELLKPFSIKGIEVKMNVKSVNIMGKAGILEGNKGDIMIPTAHVFEGTSDNYPFENDLEVQDFEQSGLSVVKGSMVTVLGTSLQNKEVLSYFKGSTWKAIGLEMEGAHYQKAIQAAAMIREGISKDVKIRYAYYASDNPLLTGHTLASGSLGEIGVKPTYLITVNILKRIFNSAAELDKLEQ